MVQIVDLYHARQHLWDLARKRSIESTNAEVLDKIRTEADYFERNAERMRYPKFRRQHLFVGAGVIEAGCKTLQPYPAQKEFTERSLH